MPMPAKAPVPAQSDPHAGHNMAGMEADDEGFQALLSGTRIILPASGSGTSRLPGNDGAMHGLHIMSGEWMLMAHGTVSLQ